MQLATCSLWRNVLLFVCIWVAFLSWRQTRFRISWDSNLVIFWAYQGKMYYNLMQVLIKYFRYTQVWTEKINIYAIRRRIGKHVSLIGIYEELPSMPLQEEENKTEETRGLSLNYCKLPRRRSREASRRIRHGSAPLDRRNVRFFRLSACLKRKSFLENKTTCFMVMMYLCLQAAGICLFGAVKCII